MRQPLHGSSIILFIFRTLVYPSLQHFVKFHAFMHFVEKILPNSHSAEAASMLSQKKTHVQAFFCSIYCCVQFQFFTRIFAINSWLDQQQIYCHSLQKWQYGKYVLTIDKNLYRLQPVVVLKNYLYRRRCEIARFIYELICSYSIWGNA